MENTPITTIAMLPTPPCHRTDCCRKFVINNPLQSGSLRFPRWEERRGGWSQQQQPPPLGLVTVSLSHWLLTAMPMYLSMQWYKYIIYFRVIALRRSRGGTWTFAMNGVWLEVEVRIFCNLHLNYGTKYRLATPPHHTSQWRVGWNLLHHHHDGCWLDLW